MSSSTFIRENVVDYSLLLFTLLVLNRRLSKDGMPVHCVVVASCDME